MCLTCNIRHMYQVNHTIRCKKCSTPFITYALGSQDTDCSPKQSQPGVQNIPLKAWLEAEKSSEPRNLDNDCRQHWVSMYPNRIPTGRCNDKGGLRKQEKVSEAVS
ncbi:hypothetical protein R3W88_007846 [Solanum pinnatisectum]|uniref:Uncharacterized protein n=1 Tax=Solanum pinnatisectum TaxID=50273 RepID=A0AAV9M6A0_9SOLN|nr:hypothetical protein R3W88_007846 [Solanum pinnatisectum]